MQTIEPNVMAFLSRSAKLIGRFEEQGWSQDVFCQLMDGVIKSPIEQLFYTAAKTLCRASYVEFNPPPSGPDSDEFGLFLEPQFIIGKYRVDFRLTRHSAYKYQPVIVELDGHRFHDKDKKQRAYEKGRDRFLVKEGYRVLHFTGSEVFVDPFRVAHESLALLGIFNGESVDEYEPSDPLGMGE